MPKVLYVCHNHPAVRAGGAEIYAHELYRAMRDAGEFESIFVAKGGPPFSNRPANDGTRFGIVDSDTSEYFFYTRRDEFDLVLGTARRKGLYIDDWQRFLEVERPDLVHFQHTLFLGYDMLRMTRRVLPHAPIVYTLHEFMPICHQNGKMIRSSAVRTMKGELCDHASPQRCHECFPRISAQSFLLRERFIKAAFEHVDMFITPSEHARHRYIEWGIPAEKVLHEDYGRFPVASMPDPPEAGRRNRIGFFGQMTPFKGVEVLLAAMKILGEEGTDVELLLHGGNLEFASLPFQEEIGKLIEETASHVRFCGNYAQWQLPALIADVDWVVVPSTWWETGPLVIHEALMHRRPVICSDIGSMVERIRDGVSGLQFRVGDPQSLADTIRRAIGTAGLWDELRSAITDPHPMDEHVATISGLYRELLDRQQQASAA